MMRSEGVDVLGDRRGRRRRSRGQIRRRRRIDRSERHLADGELEDDAEHLGVFDAAASTASFESARAAWARRSTTCHEASGLSMYASLLREASPYRRPVRDAVFTRARIHVVAFVIAPLRRYSSSDIAMDDARIVRVRQACTSLQKRRDRRSVRSVVSPSRRGCPGRLAASRLHHDVGRPCILPMIDDAEDVAVIELTCGERLGIEARGVVGALVDDGWRIFTATWRRSARWFARNTSPAAPASQALLRLEAPVSKQRAGPTSGGGRRDVRGDRLGRGMPRRVGTNRRWNVRGSLQARSGRSCCRACWPARFPPVYRRLWLFCASGSPPANLSTEELTLQRVGMVVARRGKVEEGSPRPSAPRGARHPGR